MLIRMSNLAINYWSQNRFEETEQLTLQIVDISKTVLEVEHLGTLYRVSILALTFQSLGKLKEAEGMQLKVQEM